MDFLRSLDEPTEFKRQLLENSSSTLELFGFDSDLRWLVRDPANGTLHDSPSWPLSKVRFCTDEDFGCADWEWLFRHHILDALVSRSRLIIKHFRVLHELGENRITEMRKYHYVMRRTFSCQIVVLICPSSSLRGPERTQRSLVRRYLPISQLCLLCRPLSTVSRTEIIRTS